MITTAWYRPLATFLAAGSAGLLLWLAAQFDMRTTGGYWAALGVIACCGLLLGLAQLRGRGGNPPAMLLLDFVPVLLCAGWALIDAEPHANWFRSHVNRWSGDLGIRGVVHDIGVFNGVLAFAIGLVFAFALEPRVLGHHVQKAAEPVLVDEPGLHEAEEPVTHEPVATSLTNRRSDRNTERRETPRFDSSREPGTQEIGSRGVFILED